MQLGVFEVCANKLIMAESPPAAAVPSPNDTRLNLKIFNFKKGNRIENATRNQQPSTIVIKRIEKAKDQKSMETRRIEKLKDQKSMETRRRL